MIIAPQHCMLCIMSKGGGIGLICEQTEWLKQNADGELNPSSIHTQLCSSTCAGYSSSKGGCTADGVSPWGGDICSLAPGYVPATTMDQLWILLAQAWVDIFKQIRPGKRVSIGDTLLPLNPLPDRSSHPTPFPPPFWPCLIQLPPCNLEPAPPTSLYFSMNLSDEGKGIK